MSENSKGIIYAIATAFLWGFLAIVLKYATTFIDSTSIIFLRFSIATIGLYIYLLIRDKSQFKILKSPPMLLIVAAVVLTCNYVGFMNGIDITTPENAQIIIQSGPIMLALAGVFIFKERFTVRQIIGFCCAIIGFSIFYTTQLQSQSQTSGGELSIGNLYLLGGAVSWASYAVCQKKLLLRGFNTNQLNIIIFGLPVLILAPFTDFNTIVSFSWWQWLIALFLGGNTLIAYSFLSEALKRTEAGKVSMIITMNPIITFVALFIAREFGASWAEGNNLPLVTLMGAILVLMGAVLVVLKSANKQKVEKIK